MRFSAKVIENRETEDVHVRTLVLQPETPNFTFLPGQWVSIRQPLAEKEVVRAYSMLEPDRLVLCLDAVENGLLSPYLCSISPGTVLQVAGPYGNFVLPDPLPKHLLFVARYTGIVPIYCMLRHLQGLMNPPQITLIYSLPSGAPLFVQELTAWQQSWPQFRLELIEKGPQHREQEVLTRILRQEPHVFPMIAGINDFVKPVRTLLAEFGYKRGQYAFEKFG